MTIGFASRNCRRFAALLTAVAALALELSSGCGFADPPRPQHQGPAPGFHIVGYVAGWERRTPIDTGKLTTLNYAFAHVRDGVVVLDQENARAFLSDLRSLRAGSPWLQIVVSIGGWGADGFSDAALSDASRAKFADSVAALVTEYVVDGVDIDWEYPGLPGPGIVHREEDRQGFTLLLAAIRRALDALPPRPHVKLQDDHYLLTAALADAQFVGHVELARAAEQLDWVNLMTYDFHNSLTPTTGHHSALSASPTSAAGGRSVERAVAQFLAAGVPARKLVVGVPFYGRAFADVRARNHGLDQPYGRYAGDPAWPKLKADFFDRNGFVRYRDEGAQVPYLWNEQSRTFVSYDDPESLIAKAHFVRAHGLGGMMYWEQSQDPDGELLGALDHGLHAPLASDWPPRIHR